MNDLSQEQLNELEEKYNWNLLLLQFLKEKTEADLETPIQLLQQTYDEKNLNGIRMISNQIIQWINGIPVSFQVELDAVLKERFGRGLDLVEN